MVVGWESVELFSAANLTTWRDFIVVTCITLGLWLCCPCVRMAVVTLRLSKAILLTLHGGSATEICDFPRDVKIQIKLTHHHRLTEFGAFLLAMGGTRLLCC